jgi:hypothetical protein
VGSCRRALLGLALVWASCGRNNALWPADSVCCPITDDPVPGDCIELGGAPTSKGDCLGICDRVAEYRRTIDEAGCPKLVLAACADASADAAFCR